MTTLTPSVFILSAFSLERTRAVISKDAASLCCTKRLRTHPPTYPEDEGSVEY